MIKYFISDRNISFYINGKMYDVNKASLVFNRVKEYMDNNNLDEQELLNLCNVEQFLKNWSGDLLHFEQGRLVDYNGNVLSSYYDILTKLIEKNERVDTFLYFVDKMMTVSEEVKDILLAQQLNINSAGKILCWINEDEDTNHEVSFSEFDKSILIAVHPKDFKVYHTDKLLVSVYDLIGEGIDVTTVTDLITNEDFMDCL